MSSLLRARASSSAAAAALSPLVLVRGGGVALPASSRRMLLPTTRRSLATTTASPVSVPMKYRQLPGTNLRPSVLGFGASGLGSMYGKIDEEEGIRAVHAAFASGINFFDTAPHYGMRRADVVLGKALVSLPRDKYILSTKVGREGDHFDHSPTAITKQCEEGLQRLQTNYVDLLIAHDIEFVDMNDVVRYTIPAMRELQRKGLCRYIGVSGYPLAMFEKFLSHAPPVSSGSSSSPPLVDFVLTYAHYNLHDQSLATLHPLAQERGIGLIHAAPLASGLLSESSYPVWHGTRGDARFDELVRVTDVVRTLCRARGTRIERLALTYSLTNPYAASTLVAITDRTQLAANLAAYAESQRFFPTSTHLRESDSVSVSESESKSSAAGAVPSSSEERDAERAAHALLAEVLALYAPVKHRAWPQGKPEYNTNI